MFSIRDYGDENNITQNRNTFAIVYTDKAYVNLKLKELYYEARN